MAKNKTPDDTTVALVQSLADILGSTGLTELEVETPDVTIRLAKEMTHPALAASGAVPQTVPQTLSQTPAVSQTVPEAPAPTPPPAEIDAEPQALPSPMVGTVYLAPEPQARPFINEGDTVREGQTLLIIEAMKVMNPITAPTAGTVQKILVNNAQPVEYGQPLVIID